MKTNGAVVRLITSDILIIDDVVVKQSNECYMCLWFAFTLQPALC